MVPIDSCYFLIQTVGGCEAAALRDEYADQHRNLRVGNALHQAESSFGIFTLFVTSFVAT